VPGREGKQARGGSQGLRRKAASAAFFAFFDVNYHKLNQQVRLCWVSADFAIYPVFKGIWLE
jgi:hypothetical protein